jgi:protein involved in polysaccharide export with SLBB domain
LADVLFRAGGLTIDADRRKIEISRLQIINGDLRSVTVKTMELAKTDTLYIKNDSIANYKLQPFDQIMVRKMPNFEMIENIVINGEVKYPGIYAILDKTERISDIIQRAGGLTLAAEKSDAIMTRTQEGAGYVILDLDKALQNPRSAFNYIAKGGDVITIPRAREMVSVEGAVEYPEIELLKRISMSYNPGRGVAYYINEYAGGVSEEKRGRYYLTKVRYPNGTLKATKSYFFHLIKIYPRVRPGSIITVGTKALKDKDPNNPEEKPKEKVDWEGFAQKSLAAITTVFTLLLLSQTVTGSSR